MGRRERALTKGRLPPPEGEVQCNAEWCTSAEEGEEKRRGIPHSRAAQSPPPPPPLAATDEKEEDTGGGDGINALTLFAAIVLGEKG